MLRQERLQTVTDCYSSIPTKNKLERPEKLYNNLKQSNLQPQRKLHPKASVLRSALVVQVVVKAGNHPKHHHSKPPEQGAASSFSEYSVSTN
jgi:hypothetical protein